LENFLGIENFKNQKDEAKRQISTVRNNRGNMSFINVVITLKVYFTLKSKKL